MDAIAEPPVLELKGLTKRFPGVLANDAISLSVHRGEIHALLGENGAGKSTLVKMIYGIMRPDAGSMMLAGKPYAPTSPAHARGCGISMVFQHFSLFDALTVTDNVALGMRPDQATRGLKSRISQISSTYSLQLEPDRLVGTLSAGERQRVEIVRCLLQDPQLLIMDEPTSVLTPQETDVLFRLLRHLAAQGRSILYISHKLEEIRSLCSRATVLRAGRVVAGCNPGRETARSLAELMIGASLPPPAQRATKVGDVRLKVSGLSLVSAEQFGVNLSDIAFEVRRGEVLGIAGVAGNGQLELMQALIGEQRAPRSEDIVIDGTEVGWHGPHERRALGMCFVPEERLGHATVPGMSLWENTLLSALASKRLAKRGLIDIRSAATFTQQVIDNFGVKTGGIKHAPRLLSGGNVQKFIVGREILQSPVALIASQPTWGVDAGAAAGIHEVLLGLARDGAAIVIISQDLDELFALSNRISVIAGGRLTPARRVEELTVETLGLCMGGHDGAQVLHA